MLKFKNTQGQETMRLHDNGELEIKDEKIKESYKKAEKLEENQKKQGE